MLSYAGGGCDRIVAKPTCADSSQNHNQFYFRAGVKTLKQLRATIGVREVAKPTIILALNLSLFRAFTMKGNPFCNTRIKSSQLVIGDW